MNPDIDENNPDVYEEVILYIIFLVYVYLLSRI